MKIPKWTTFIASLLIILFWSSLANEGLFALSEKLYTDNGINHALIIGIGDYEQWPKLSSPPKDAKEIARILTEKYNFKQENIELLTDDSKEKPTLVTIVTYLDKYVSTLTEKDNLLIFYSGHSTEDEDGDTYWIPKNAQKKLKMTWLSHSGICEEYLASDKFKAKNVAIVTDSLFSKKLLKPTSIVLSPYDLRYPEKITEKATKRSREVIAFGDKHWPGSGKTEGFGLFTYYFRKALIDNWFKVIDLENLIFNEDMIFQVRKVAGTRLLRGRLKKSPMEDEGQTIITRVLSPPPVDITNAYVNPKKGFVGDKFIIEAITNRSAFEVYVELKGKKYLMEGEGTEWRHSIQVASLGTSPYKVLAINEDDLEGKSKKGEITTIQSLASMVNVTNASASPQSGLGGDEFSFSAKTDSPAQKVTLIIEGNRYEMTGSGTDWSLKRKVEETGAVAFSIAALNKDGLEGRSKGGVVSIKAPQVNIVELKTSPDKGYAGDEFSIIANTDHPARSVALDLDGVTYVMQGSGKEWSLKRKIPDIGKKKLIVIAKNMEGKPGLSKSVEIMTSERPAGIPDVTTVALSPKKVYAGENFVIRVKTSTDAEGVFLELEGKKQPMEGSGTEWKYSTQIASVGDTGYKVTARNKDGKEGRPSEGKITTTEKAKKGIDVIKAAVSPQKGNQGQTFTFEATTNAPAENVTAVIGDKKYSMTGSGTNWSLKKKIDNLGSIDFYVIATDKKGSEGSSKGGSFATKALLANVIDAKVTSENGYIGEEFTFTVNTDNPASSVSLEMGGVTYNMEG
ncbi:MAG: caspase family protein, partial [Deltaproteobacteria bacterium]|nr:caspase family protein [Deltaproteobacteria bacterium]